MQIKFNNAIPSGSYAEIPQTNNLRWVNCFKEEDGTITHESKLWKCKDFLNEVVSRYQGNKTQIYGYDAGSMRFNDDGVWLRLKFIDNMDVFKKNLGSISTLPGYVDFDVYDCEEGLMLFVPKWYFENTYRISILTYLIRVSNVDKEITDWTNHPTKPVDNPSPKFHDAIIKRGFVEPIKDHWYYVGKAYTDLKKPNTGTVHNCGMDGWMKAAKADGIIQ